MHGLFERLRRARAWLKVESEEGATALEYGLLAGLIAAGIAAAVTTLGANIATVFNLVASNIHT
ncbi:MAG: Flp family type IVb pilin [Rhodomicrobium sp.]|jgi:pilus assembly protein Flp/PilA